MDGFDSGTSRAEGLHGSLVWLQSPKWVDRCCPYLQALNNHKLAIHPVVANKSEGGVWQNQRQPYQCLRNLLRKLNLKHCQVEVHKEYFWTLFSNHRENS